MIIRYAVHICRYIESGNKEDFSLRILSMYMRQEGYEGVCLFGFVCVRGRPGLGQSHGATHPSCVPPRESVCVYVRERVCVWESVLVAKAWRNTSILCATHTYRERVCVCVRA